MKTALITGITGQDGSYLTERLLAKGYTVHGLVRRASMFNRSRIDHLRSPGDRPGRTPGSQQGTTAPASDRLSTIRDFAMAALKEVGLELKFEGRGEAEVGRRTDTGAVVIKVDPRYYRPADSTHLVGDATRARHALGWAPQTIGTEVARLMARADWESITASGKPGRID